jgi:hypothetical protein
MIALTTDENGGTEILDSNDSEENEIDTQVDPDFRGSDIDETQDISMSEMFDILKNKRRRRVVNYLQKNDDVAVLNDLAERIAADENNIPINQLSSDQRKRVYIGLYQCHLPKMDAVGIVDYNKSRGLIKTSDNFDKIVSVIEQTNAGLDDEDEASFGKLKPAMVVGFAGLVGSLIVSITSISGWTTGIIAVGLSVVLIWFGLYEYYNN